MMKIKAKAYALLAKKDYFAKELSLKLKQKGYPEGEIDSLIKELVDRGFLNDQALALRFAEREKKRGYGPVVIAHKLREKAGVIELDLTESEEPLQMLIDKRYRKELPENKNRVVRSLMRRGYSYHLIQKLLRNISGDEEE